MKKNRTAILKIFVSLTLATFLLSSVLGGAYDADVDFLSNDITFLAPAEQNGVVRVSIVADSYEIQSSEEGDQLVTPVVGLVHAWPVRLPGHEAPLLDHPGRARAQHACQHHWCRRGG